MYCIHCGVKLEDDKRKCPLCGTVLPCDPSIGMEEPIVTVKRKTLSRESKLWIFTISALLITAVILSIDLSMNGTLTWAGYVSGGLLLCYMAVLVPLWPCKSGTLTKVVAEYGIVALYLFGLERALEENWFSPVVLPVILVSCVVTLTAAWLAMRRPAWRLAIAGGTCLAVGAQMVLLEALRRGMLGQPGLGWSPWVMLGCFVVGGFLLTVALCSPLREKLIKRMFV